MEKPISLEWTFKIKDHLISKEDGEEKFYISGFASISDKIDRNEPLKIITDQAIRDALKDLDINNILFYEHDRTQGIGKIVDKEYTPGVGIWIKAYISSTAEKIRKLVQEGILTGLSIGANILDCAEKIIESGETVLEILKMELIEVSLVYLPASLDTRVLEYEIIKSLKGGEIMDNQELNQEAKEEEKVSKEIKTEETKTEEVKTEETKVEETKTEAEVTKSEEKYPNPEDEEKKKKEEEDKKAEEEKKKKEKECYEDEEKKKKEKEYEEKKKKDYYGGLAEKLKDALKAKDEKELREAIDKIINDLDTYYKEYSEKHDKTEKKEEQPSNVEMVLRGNTEELQKALALLGEVSKKVEEINSKPLLTEDKVKEIVKDMIREIPDPTELRKGLDYIKEKEKEEKKEEKKSPSEKIKEGLQERFSQ